MSFRTFRGYKLILWSLTLVCLGGAGYLGYKTFYTAGSPSRTLKTAEEAYARGIAAYDQKNWTEAATRFDEAKLLSEKAEQQLDEHGKAGKVTVEEGTFLLGQIMWVKARAIRDQAYAKAQADGKPIGESPDPQYKETFRPFVSIPDATARAEAIVAMRKAGGLCGATDPEVLKEAVRLEVVLPNIQWRDALPLLREAIKQNPKDARAHYYLAWYEFDQPESGVTSPDKKSSEGVKKAYEHLKEAKANDSPYWRTIGLEADILNWTTLPAVIKAKHIKPDVVAADERALDQLLFEPNSGAIATAQRGEKLTGFGRADGPGLVNVLTIGMDRAVAEANKPGGGVGRVKAVSRAALDMASKMGDSPGTKQFLPDVLAALARSAATAQPYLAKADPAAWREYIIDVQAAVGKAGSAGQSTPPSVKFQLAQIGFADALVAARAGNSDQFKELTQKCLALAEEGVKGAEDAKLQPVTIDTYHATIAEWKMMTGAKAEAVEPHLARLRSSASTWSKLKGQFLDAIVAERQGKLDKARKLLQPIASEKSKELAGLARSAHLVLANLNMVLGDPSAALVSLRETEPMYKQLESLPPIERAWQEEFARGGLDDNFAQQVRAHLQIAWQIAQRHKKENPKVPVPSELLDGNLKAASDLIKKLRAPSAADRTARLAFASFDLLAGRRNEAETLIAELATDYPESIDVLRTQCAVLTLPVDSTGGAFNPNGVAAADVLIRKYLKDYPTEKAGKLFNAEWLVRTDRAEKAIEYLRDPMNFPGGRDSTVDRILGTALLRTGQRAEAQKLLSTLPHDPRLDTVLIETAVTRESGEKYLKEALSRYENQGRFRIYEAAMRLKDGKHEDAIRGFISAIEFTEVAANAKAGLILALVAYANAEPAKARDTAVRLASEMPDEAGIYLAAADAAIQLNEIGDPSDRWENTKTVYAALSKWETAALKNGTSRGDVALTKARARLLAGDPDGAKRDAVIALKQSPDNVQILLLLAELSLMPPADTARAREFYDTAFKKSPNTAALPYIDARIREASGDWVGAAAVYQKLISDSPRNPAPYVGMVVALDSASQKESALKAAQEWYAKIPEDGRSATEIVRLLIETGKKPEAVKFADDFVLKQVADARKRVADSAAPLEPAEADKYIDNARTKATLNAVAGLVRGKVYDEAEKRTDEILRAQPRHNGALLVTGDIAIATKQWDRALAAYRELLKENPRHFLAGNNLAWILTEQKNEPAAALAVVEEIRKGRGTDKPISPERLPPDFLDTLGVVYLKLNRPDRFAEMRTLFEAAAKRYPTDPRMFLYLGHAQVANGERSKALESFDTATKLAGAKNGLPADQNKAVIDGAAAALKKLRG
jgi:predicted Zn-dependent protease